MLRADSSHLCFSNARYALMSLLMCIYSVTFKIRAHAEYLHPMTHTDVVTSDWCVGGPRYWASEGSLIPCGTVESERLCVNNRRQSCHTKMTRDTVYRKIRFISLMWSRQVQREEVKTKGSRTIYSLSVIHGSLHKYCYVHYKVCPPGCTS